MSAPQTELWYSAGDTDLVRAAALVHGADLAEGIIR